MLKRNRKPTCPGEILKHHYLKPREVSQKTFSSGIGISQKHLSRIVTGHARLEPDVAVRIAKSLGTTTAFWVNLQAAVDVWTAEQAYEGWRPQEIYQAKKIAAACSAR
ncbi:HigA family addiction module antitoxin [Varunaivibrio sulfuroxidans]|uniref:Addiction module HigA family antidote n=1 Tax=Varunaivibrio sulfuroxidans TaxID=1773489 RepID=A0A4R3J576_9PROT|nr:HigA family addiction module antitoxin [Varunaivibrio sulfuroxidans]TCS59966.1 addiction module HigA family antidote [Varunaivibrio sulfuroxidans]WES31751.1 HigA family addiction module antitoxin [Varunaivibrio sulfuroxidans]